MSQLPTTTQPKPMGPRERFRRLACDLRRVFYCPMAVRVR